MYRFVLNGIKIEVYLQHHSVFGSPSCGHMHSKKDLAFGSPKAFSFSLQNMTNPIYLGI